jgi:competence protein ComEC
MSKSFDIPIWKTAPFLRLLLPLVAGIVLQWYLQMEISLLFASILSFSVAFLLFSYLPISGKFKLHFLQGIVLQLILVAFGMLLAWQKDVRHSKDWYGQKYDNGDFIVATISEPLIEKARSFKADAYVEQIIHDDKAVNCSGKILLYFSKDAVPNNLHYGDKIIIKKKLQAIKNSGNPGAFDYERYAAFQQTFHNAFLQPSDWTKLDDKNVNAFSQFIFSARASILSVLQQNVGNNKDELGIAEALLIGYTNDLDKDLVQAYSNTGVVHIIAISGMHLGLIYVMLVWLFKRTPVIKKSTMLQVILILCSLWLFSILTGAAASVLRSAVMFTFITIGKNFFRQSSIFNSLAASAFVMLCFNPYYLWDVGFQLSYLAVVGIIIFQKPIYNWIYVKNKYLNEVWKLVAISLAAQLLTFPVCIYYFHQFPNLFLITNLVAVPLSSIILFAEIALVALAWIPMVGALLGKMVSWLVWIMNKFILLVNDISFSVTDHIAATALSTWLLYGVVIALSAWLLKKDLCMLRAGLIFCVGFFAVHAYGEWQIKNQHKVIVYNVPKHKAIDFVQGNNYHFDGDSILLEDGVLQNFHLKPARIFLQMDHKMQSVPGGFQQGMFYQFQDKKIVVIDKPLAFEPASAPIDVDLVIISKGPKLDIAALSQAFNCHQFVFDASNSLWKIDKWKQDCDKLNLRFHSIPQQGAFVLNL